jgi:4,5-DOPA dioxygenase extradiol
MSRAPVLFVSHGAPTVALEEDRPFARALAAFGGQHRPRAVAALSAHWTSRGEVGVTGTDRPPLIYDFAGFPEALYRIRYPAPGAPDVAARAVALLGSAGFRADIEPTRGLDHGAWVPLRLAWPAADVPVVQIAVPDAAPEALLRFGAALAPLRDDGVLLLASGGVVHNLGRVRFGAPDSATSDRWAAEFDAWCAERIEALDAEGLARWQSAPGAALAAPTPEHLDPLLIAIGARSPGDRVETLHTGFQHGTIGMRSFALRPGGDPAVGLAPRKESTT